MQNVSETIKLVKLAHIQTNHNKALNLYRKAVKARGRERESLMWRAQYTMDGITQDPFAIAYRPRLGIFKGYNGNLDFNPATGLGHSYSWYQLAKVINGVQVLNTYDYSQQTTKHYRDLASVLKTLGIKFVCIEAPKGLQNLQVAQDHIIERISKLAVKMKYARGSSNWEKAQIESLKKQLQFLKKCGFVTTKAMLDEGFKTAEINRRTSLDRLSRIRAERKAMAQLEIIIDVNNERMDEAGLHLFKPYIVETTPTYCVDSWEKTRAVREGHTKVFVHKRNLAVVTG